MQNNLMLNSTADIQQPSFPAKSKLIVSSVIIVFCLVPIYLFGSGGFQIVDMPIMLLMIYVICTLYKHEIQLLSMVSLPLSAFVLWALSINIFYYASSFQPVYIKASIQTMYTAFIFFVFSVLFLRISTYKKEYGVYLFCGIVLSLFVPLVIKGNPDSGIEARQVFSFTNPNQLASYTIIIIAITLVLSHHLQWNNRREKIIKAIGMSSVFILAHYYIIMAASRAGIASIIFIDFIMLYRYKNRVLLFIAIPIIVIAILFSGLLSVHDLNTTAIYKKFIQKGNIYADLEKRTTGRFNTEGLTVFLGAGKKNKSLGMSGGVLQKEIHNTFLDIVYSYGLIGGGFFTLFLYMYLKTCVSATYYIVLMFSILPMAMTHNLIRFRILWIFLAMVFSITLIRTNLSHPSISKMQRR